jgi:uncharacterized protein YigE (DUF2233 family)
MNDNGSAVTAAAPATAAAAAAATAAAATAAAIAVATAAATAYDIDTQDISLRMLRTDNIQYAIRTARLASLTRVARLEAGSLYVETVSPKR